MINPLGRLLGKHRCKVCGKRFKTPAALGSHVMRYHGSYSNSELAGRVIEMKKEASIKQIAEKYKINRHTVANIIKETREREMTN